MAGNFRGQTFNALMQPRAVYDRPLAFRGTIAALKPGTVRSATTGETLFSDTGKPSLMGSAVSSTIHDDSNSGAVNDPAWLEDFLRRYY